MVYGGWAGIRESFRRTQALSSPFAAQEARPAERTPLPCIQEPEGVGV